MVFCVMFHTMRMRLPTFRVPGIYENSRSTTNSLTLVLIT